MNVDENASQFQRIAALFEEALQLPPEERSGYLDQQCNGDHRLRDEVEHLLQSDNRPHQVFDSPPTPARELLRDLSQSRDAASNDDGHASLPKQIGPYDIIRRIGVGGMGVVYLARQQNPSRLVALKVIRGSLAQPNLVGRFQTEANALARLQHSGIAQIIEAGTAQTDVGDHPYFAMEFVDGESITQYADDHALGIDDRLALMADVCDAVHHAHKRGVLLHRDLKPGNILIVDDGDDDVRHPRPKILDFGVARIMSDGDDAARTNTFAGQIVGTLAYMSPEQAGGGSECDQRSDVYSLGVILYELLGGRRPLEVETGSVTEAVRIIREDEPESLGAIDARLRGDIETIVAKAMEKNPARRYEDAALLAADIRRCLRSEPIVAHPATSIDQIRKYARRHRVPMAALAAVVVFSVTAVTVGILLGRGNNGARPGETNGRQAGSADAPKTTAPATDAAWPAYVAAIAGAESALRNHDVGDAIWRLKEAQRAARGWEWRHLWNRVDRSQVRLARCAGGVHALAADDRGNWIAIGDGEGRVHLCDADTGQPQTDIDTPITRAVTALAIDTSGRRIAVGGAGGEILVYTAHSSDPPIRLAGHLATVVGAGWDADGTHLITASRDRTVRRWDVAAQSEVAMRNFGAPINSMTLSPGRNTVVITDRNHAHALAIGDLTDVANIVEQPSTVQCAAISQHGWLVAGHGNGDVSLHTTDDLREVRRWKATDSAVSSIAFDSTGGIVFVGGGSVLSVWQAQSGERIAAFLGHTDVVNHLAVIASDWLVSAGSRDGIVRIWNQNADTVRRFTGLGRDALDVAASPVSSLAAAAQGQYVHVWNVATNQHLHTIAMSPYEVRDVEFTPDGSELWLLNVTTTNIERRVAADGRLVSEIDTPEKPHCFDIASDGRTIAMGYLRTGQVVILDAVTGAIRTTIEAHRSHNVLSVAFSPDGRRLVSCGSDGMAQVWDGETYQTVAAVKVPGQEFMHAAFSSDGTMLATATAGQRNEIQLWSTASWTQLAALHGHTDQINRVAFLDRDRRLASVSHDGTLRIWEVPSGRLAATLRGHNVCIWSMDVVQDGKVIVTGGGDSTVRFWDG